MELLYKLVYLVEMMAQVHNSSNLVSLGQLPCSCQAWIYMEATEIMASIAPGLGLGALSTLSHRHHFTMEVPIAK